MSHSLVSRLLVCLLTASLGSVALAGTAGGSSVPGLDPSPGRIRATDTAAGPAAAAGSNVLQNGDFSAGTTGWRFFTNGVGEFSVVGGEARVAITVQGSNVQLYQKSVALKGSTDYLLTFRARNTLGSDLEVRLHKHTSPFSNYGLKQTVFLGVAEETISIPFRTTAGDKTDARFMLWLGPFDQAGGTYHLDDFVLREASSTCGDGVIDAGEACDDGNVVSGDGCDSACQVEAAPICGDGVIDAGEACDDGNTADGDGCSAGCTTEVPGGPNALVNADFQAGTPPWKFYSNGSATFHVINGEARVSIAVPGSNVQLYQKDVALKGNTDYRLTFRGRNSTGRDVRLRLNRHTAPNEDYGLQETVDLTPDEQFFSLTFRTTAGDKDDGRFMLWFAPYDQAGSIYYLDDFAIAEVGAAVCGDGTLDAGEECDDGNTADGDGCDATCHTEIAAACGDGTLDAGEECDDGNTADGDGCDATCHTEIAAACGDGTLDAGEECDDGNTADGDGCDATCHIEIAPACGDGTLDAGEECDDGNTAAGDGCDATCQIEAGLPPNLLVNGDFEAGRAPWIFFSNGAATYHVIGGEARVAVTVQGTNVQLYQRGVVLQGDTQYRLTLRARSSDGRDVQLRLHRHGTPFSNYGLLETLDLTSAGQLFDLTFRTPPGDLAEGRFVLWLAPFDKAGTTYWFDDIVLREDAPPCGNGILDAGEQCDDGNTTPGDGCSPTCRDEVCGNGVVDAGEACDDGNTTPGDGCSADCAVECGNGLDDPGEECDDGNAVSGDGCSTTCRIEACGNGVVDVGEGCDDGNTASGDGCSAGCLRETTCGDGVVDPGEACDDGNQVSDDGCSRDCTIEPARQNLLVNGDYSAGKTAWSFFSNGDASFDTATGQARIAVTTPGSNVQLYQRGVTLEPETIYIFRFRGRNTGGDNVQVRLFQHATPHTDYGMNLVFNLTTDETEFRHVFVTPAGSLTEARLMFWMAPYDRTGQQYHFDDVAIEPFGPDDESPTVPGGLHATAFSSSRIDLGWSAADDNLAVTGYKIYRDGTEIAETAEKTYRDTGLAASTSYGYAVAAFDAAGNVSARSGEVFETTRELDVSPPSTPTDLQAQVLSSSVVELTWGLSTDNVGVVRYDILRDGVPEGSTELPLFTVSGLAAGVTHTYQVLAVDADQNASLPATVVATTSADPFATTIHVWYGDDQTFGLPGVSQQYVNVLGQVSDPDGIGSLAFTLNGGPSRPLTVGPDGRRLQNAGDFAIEIDFAELNNGANTVVLVAEDALGHVAQKTVTVNYAAGNVWPLNYSVDWSTADDLLQTTQIVDGRWILAQGGVRPVLTGYDRLLAVGDRTWTDYEVVFSVTVHGRTPGAPQLQGLGLILRWTGHTDSPVVCAQPHCGWLPHANSLWYPWTDEGGTPGSIVGGTLVDPTGRILKLGRTYLFKVRVETVSSSEHLYRFKVWAADEDEPVAWTDSGLGDPSIPQGSILLIAHHLDLTFGEIRVTPLAAPVAPATRSTLRAID